MTKYFEEFEVGDVLELGTFTFTKEAIINFAHDYDPQPFHLDEELAKTSLFEGLCASGWHTAVVWASLLSKYWHEQADARTVAGLDCAKIGPSPGFNNLKWFNPVYPNDELLYTAIVDAKRPMNTHPEWGLVTFRGEALRRDGTLMMQFSNHIFIERQAL